MIKLLIIADDFTGALDSAVQFAKRGFCVQASAEEHIDLASIDEATEVFSYSTESRHLPPKEAYVRVFQVAQQAKHAGIPRVYKKVDSALRGNIGIELQAAMEGFDIPFLTFLPAYPEMGRTTEKGIHYINGVPVAQSPLGQDPFNPVIYSGLSAVLRMQTQVPTCNMPADFSLSHETAAGIVLCDGQTDGDLARAAAWVCKPSRFLAAGSAGLCAALAAQMHPTYSRTPSHFPSPALFVFGSICPQAEAQAAQLCREIPSVLTPEIFGNTEDQRHCVEDLQKHLRTVGAATLITRHPTNLRPSDEERRLAGQTIATIAVQSLQSANRFTLAVIGGDTLFFVTKLLCDTRLTIKAELLPGIVLAEAKTAQGQQAYVISKAGSFGTPDTMKEIYHTICRKNEETL